MMRLAALHVYPIKSCRGTSLGEAVIGPRGIQGDRRWMLVVPEGRFLSQRRHPRLALVQPELLEDRLRVTAPGAEPLEVDPEAPGPELEVEIWADRCAAVDQGDEAAGWFSRFLDAPVRLVRQGDEADRPVDPAYARSPGDQVSFTDGYPLLLASQASLDDLNARLPEALPMNRFRPNLVVEGSHPWDEDRWALVRIGALELNVVKPCSRCVITTVDQERGVKGKEPLQTMATFRRGIPGAPPGGEGEVYFGQNLIHREEGVLRVGDPVEVLDLQS